MPRASRPLLTLALSLLLALPLLSLCVREARAAEPAPNVIRYIPEEDWVEGMTQKEQEAKAHTIHWTYGINPPIMGHEISAPQLQDKTRTAETVGEFYHEKVGADYYLAPYKEGNGWYDVNKRIAESGSGGDSKLCFVLSSVNLLHWWMDQNRDNIDRYLQTEPDNKNDIEKYAYNSGKSVNQDPSNSNLWSFLTGIYASYTGGWPDRVLDHFFNGYPFQNAGFAGGSRSLPSDFPAAPDQRGGLFHQVFGKSILTDMRKSGNYEQTAQDLADSLDQGNAIVAIVHNAKHAITLWGVEFDENQQLCAVYVVDNNDREEHIGGNPEKPLIGMIRYNTVKNAEGKLVFDYLHNPRSSQDLTWYMVLSPAREGWEAFWKTGKPMYKNGQAFLNPMKDTAPSPGCDHSFVYVGEGDRIMKRCEKCGHEKGYRLIISMGRSTQYTGAAVKPCGVRPFNDPDFSIDATKISYTYENGNNVGGATATLTAKLDGQMYTATLRFSITPKPAEKPIERPTLQGEVGPHGFSVQPVAGREFAICPAGEEFHPEKANWQREGSFTGLAPKSTYTVYIRSVSEQPGNPNYTHSAPGENSLTVTTAEGKPLGDPRWSLSLAQGGELKLTVQNDGRQESATLVVAAYTDGNRQHSCHVETITLGGGSQEIKLPRDPALHYRAFLLGTDSRPLCKAA